VMLAAFRVTLRPAVPVMFPDVLVTLPFTRMSLAAPTAASVIVSILEREPEAEGTSGPSAAISSIDLRRSKRTRRPASDQPFSVTRPPRAGSEKLSFPFST